ncbi:T9SS type A sorting domain-containing protein [Paenimyroides aestuarii]|uniref:T9SS type A sorting domain-containing protein n=1 Tax=Paenimyroides aestuarii TaxID=2968490 RepID=A0ABY5NVH4_9FLAO|nr:T9SS type A sorting domain-containing protein [Paenimyroides aestuarii]UUV22468.1 T9SS type A sorting domain-containing protein [Paenimyroides aestuarii]
MNKKLLFAATFAMCSNFLTAQVLYSENFDNLTIGNLTTDFTGQTPGQGGLYGMSHTTIPYSAIQIKTEPNKGNVLYIDTDSYNGNVGRMVEKRDLDIVFNQRTQGNDLLKFQFDFYTGKDIPTDSPQIVEINIHSAKYFLGGFRFYGNEKILKGKRPQSTYNNGFMEKFIGKTYNTDLVLPANQWVTLAVTIDFTNAKIYFEIPHLGIVYQYDSLPFTFTDPTSTDEPNTNGTPVLLRIGQSYINTNDPISMYYMYDNFNFSAINTPPTPTVSVAEVLSNSFNLFPNPASNTINITNSDNYFVQNVKIYDTSGKLLKTQHFNNQKEVQLNIESLTNGIYLLHIHTDKGVAVKKVVKK